MKKYSLIFLALMMVAAGAFAQHGGPGPGPMDHGPGGPGDFGPGGGPGADASVGSDGSIFLTKVTESNNAYTTTITAVRPTGTVGWTATVNAAAHVIVSDGNVIAESGARNSDGTFTTTLNAFAAST